MFTQIQRQLMDNKNAMLVDCVVNENEIVRVLAIFHGNNKADLTVRINSLFSAEREYKASVSSNSDVTAHIHKLVKTYLTSVYGEDIVSKLDEQNVRDIIAY